MKITYMKQKKIHNGNSGFKEIQQNTWEYTVPTLNGKSIRTTLRMLRSNPQRKFLMRYTEKLMESRLLSHMYNFRRIILIRSIVIYRRGLETDEKRWKSFWNNWKRSAAKNKWTKARIKFKPNQFNTRRRHYQIY